MTDYQLTATDLVMRTHDGAWIPNDPNNADRQAYEQWLTEGGVPDPYTAPFTFTPFDMGSSMADRLGA